MSAAPTSEIVPKINNTKASNNTDNVENINSANKTTDPESRKSSTQPSDGQEAPLRERPDHCHRERKEGVDKVARKKLVIASILCIFFMTCEIIGGVLSNSLAIATDAAHLLTDFASFVISIIALYIAARPPTPRMSFGWYRAEIMGALASVTMIWMVTSILVYMAAKRVINNDFEVDADIMLITSGLAILVNLVMGLQLQHGHSHFGLSHSHGHSHVDGKEKQGNPRDNVQSIAADVSNNVQDASVSAANNSELPQDAHGLSPTPPSLHLESGANELVSVAAKQPEADSTSNQKSPSSGDVATARAETTPPTQRGDGKAKSDKMNLNVRAALIHVFGDMIQSFGVFVAAVIIYYRPDWAIVDPVCTFLFSVIVLLTTLAIIKDALIVLMEGTPSGVRYADYPEIFKKVEGVKCVHNLRIWALSVDKVALVAHLAVEEDADSQRILEEATAAAHQQFDFFETTIQIEDFTPEMEKCHQCRLPPPRIPKKKDKKKMRVKFV